MFQKVKPIRGATVSSTLPVTNTLLSHDPLTPLHCVESNLSPSKTPLMVSCHSWSKVRASLSILCGPPPRTPVVSLNPLDWQLAILWWDHAVVDCNKQTHQSLDHLPRSWAFSTELDGQCIPQSHFAFWKHISRHSRTHKAVCLRCRDYIRGNVYWQASSLVWWYLQFSELWRSVHSKTL